MLLQKAWDWTVKEERCCQRGPWGARAIWETGRKKWSRMDLKTSLKWISALLPWNKGPISCWSWPSGSSQSPWTKCVGEVNSHPYCNFMKFTVSWSIMFKYVLMQREAIIRNDKIWRCWESTFLLSGDRTHWSPLTSCYQGSLSPNSQYNRLIVWR